MVLSFVGAFVFVGIAVVTNQGIAYESFEYISRKTEATDFDGFGEDVVSNVKFTFDSANDEYTEFLADASGELNDGISYFLNFLANVDDLTKGEHSTLIDGYDVYLSNFASSQTAYDSYISAYQYAVEAGGTTYATNLVSSKEDALAKAYLATYESGSEFFKDLASIVKKYAFSSGYTYACESYMIKIGLCDYACDEIFASSRTSAYQVDSNALVSTFNNFCLNASDYDDGDLLINNNFKSFVDNLNDLDIYSWAGNYAEYVSGLTTTLVTKAQTAHSFFDGGNF